MAPELSTVRTAVWGPLSTRVRQSRILREPSIAVYRAFARVALTGPPPKVFANSVAKAGTHLLIQLLAGVDQLWFSGRYLIDKNFSHDRARGVHAAEVGLGHDLDEFRRLVGKVRNGQFVAAHVGAQPGVVRILDELGFARLLMVRDPRDVAVSLAFYLASNRRLHTYRRFAVELTSDHDRLMAAITGLPAADGMPAIPSIGERLRRYRGWLDDTETCVVRFEDLVGVRGGGSTEAQFKAVRDVLRQCRRDSSDETVSRLAEAVFAPHSATFRRGVAGGWRDHLSTEHLEAFEQVAPGQIDAFGY